MTPKASTARLVSYVLLAMISAAMAGLAAIDFADPKQVAFFTLGILGSGVTAFRSYIDQSPTQIVTDAVTTIAQDVIRKRRPPFPAEPT